MNQITKVDPGRVDHLALGVFDKLLRQYANPHVRLACGLLSDEIAECFEEHLGPGTAAHDFGKRVIRVMGGRR